MRQKLEHAFVGDMRLSKADVELTVRMLNINHGHNSLLMGKCRVLKEYAEFVDITRKFMLEEKHVETALAEAVDYCIEKGILEMFLRKTVRRCWGCCWKSLT